ncbi:MAG TPA: hypothetical protein VG934_01565 [Candidatus Paceibacterota bacterium]|nr:hypothetical protein [Candidatus Paceibacterota bacterium]
MMSLVGLVVAMIGVYSFFLWHLSPDKASGITGLGGLLIVIAIIAFNYLRREDKRPAK